MRPLSPIPIPVKTALRKLGQDLRHARVRRRITMELMSQRASISRTTLTKVEKGDPSVALGVYASVIFVLGMLSNLVTLFDTTKYELGRLLEEEHLPKRVRFPSLTHTKESENGGS